MGKKQMLYPVATLFCWVILYLIALFLLGMLAYTAPERANRPTKEEIKIALESAAQETDAAIYWINDATDANRYFIRIDNSPWKSARVKWNKLDATQKKQAVLDMLVAHCDEMFANDPSDWEQPSPLGIVIINYLNEQEK